jgi:hypothetical protein
LLAAAEDKMNDATYIREFTKGGLLDNGSELGEIQGSRLAERRRVNAARQHHGGRNRGYAARSTLCDSASWIELDLRRDLIRVISQAATAMTTTATAATTTQ